MPFLKMLSLSSECAIEKANRTFLTNKTRIIVTKCVLEWFDFVCGPVISWDRLSNLKPERSWKEESCGWFRLIAFSAFPVSVPPTASYQTLSTCLCRAGWAGNSVAHCWDTLCSSWRFCEAEGAKDKLQGVDWKRTAKLTRKLQERGYQSGEHSGIPLPLFYFRPLLPWYYWKASMETMIFCEVCMKYSCWKKSFLTLLANPLISKTLLRQF